MSLALVPRSVQALSDHINAYYRVFRGSDQDSIFLRLAALGGSFEVRHSATNAAVFKVTDAGVQGILQGGDIVDGTIDTPELKDQSVTSAKIKDGTIVDVDISGSAAINGGKIAAGTVSGGASGQIAASTITSSNIQDLTIVDGDISTTANIDGSKLANFSIPSGKLGDSIITSAKIQDDTIVNADVNSAAAIAVTKVAHVGANNVLKSNGTTNVAGQVVNGDIAAAGTANIALAKLANVTTNQIVKDVGSGVVGGGLLVDANVAAAGTANIALAKLANVTTNQIVKDVGSGVVGGGLLVDANVAAAGTANIALAKLAPGSSGVLKSNGTAITAGNLIVTGDMAVNTINGDRIQDATITGAKITGGAPPPNGTGVSDAYKVYATAAAGTTVSLQPVVTGMVAANAITQVLTTTPTTGSPSTTSTSPVVMPEMSVPITTTGGPILVIFSGNFYGSSVGAQCTIQPFEFGVGPIGQPYQFTVQSGSQYMLMAHSVLWTPGAPGSRAIDMRWYVSAGTFTNNSVARSLTVVELKR